jgi:hypothetical protein
MSLPARKLFLRAQVHLSRGAGPPDVEMMKRDRRLDHRLEKQFFLWSNFTHPTFFPRVVRRMKFAGVVEIDPGDVLDRIRRNVRVEISAFNSVISAIRLCIQSTRDHLCSGSAGSGCAADRRRNGFETSPTANTIGTFVSC